EDLVELELPMLTDDFAKDLEAYGRRGHYEAAPVTVWTIFTEDMLQAFPGSLAGHFDQPEGRHRSDLVPCVIAKHRLFEHLHHPATMFFLLHVDEIDDDDPAQVAQPELPCDGDGRFQVGAEIRFFEVPVTHVAARFHVHRGHRFGLVEYDVPPRFQ